MAICKVCDENESKYICPRCEAPYCSLPCYKAHSADCLESFYKAQIDNELQSQKTSPEERKKLESILQRLKKIDQEDFSDEEEQDDEQETPEQIAEREKYHRLQTLADNPDLDVSDLTPEEMALFEEFVKEQVKNHGENLDFQVWRPWWESKVLDQDILTDRVEDVAHVCCGKERKANRIVGHGVFELLSKKGRKTVSNDAAIKNYNFLIFDDSVFGYSSHPKNEKNVTFFEFFFYFERFLFIFQKKFFVKIFILFFRFAYAHMARTYNGDWQWDVGPACRHLLSPRKGHGYHFCD